MSEAEVTMDKSVDNDVIHKITSSAVYPTANNLLFRSDKTPSVWHHYVYGEYDPYSNNRVPWTRSNTFSDFNPRASKFDFYVYQFQHKESSAVWYRGIVFEKDYGSFTSFVDHLSRCTIYVLGYQTIEGGCAHVLLDVQKEEAVKVEKKFEVQAIITTKELAEAIMNFVEK